MEYTIGVRGRLVLLGILPPTGDLSTILIVRELREGLSFSEAEHADLQMQSEDGRVVWQEGAVPDRTFDIGAKAQEIIRAALKKLDDEEKLAVDHLELCDLFEYE